MLVEGEPYTVLKKVQLDYVHEQLMKSLEKSIDSGTKIPQFQELGLRHGRFHLSCANTQIYKWLQEAVADICVSSSRIYPASKQQLGPQPTNHNLSGKSLR